MQAAMCSRDSCQNIITAVHMPGFYCDLEGETSLCLSLMFSFQFHFLLLSALVVLCYFI